MQPNIVFAFADDWGRYASAYRPIVSHYRHLHAMPFTLRLKSLQSVAVGNELTPFFEMRQFA